jgi:peptide/nickel transport system permease protein
MVQSVAVQPAASVDARRPVERTAVQRVASSLRLSGRAMFGLGITLLAILSALVPDLLSPHDPLKQQILARLQAPVWMTGDPSYLVGADAVGRDLLSRMIHGARVSMGVGIASVLVAGVTGTLLGLAAGHFGGVIDAVLMRAVDTWYAVPTLVLAIAVAVVLGPGIVNVIIVLGFTTWVVYARIVRGQVLAVRGMDYVTAARVVGAGDGRIMFRHLLPNVTTSLIVVATQQVAAMILFEASLSFLGLGVQPPTPTWGGMVADGRNYVTTAWWASTIPGLAIVLTVLGINLLGDWLRDFLDPRQKLL